MAKVLKIAAIVVGVAALAVTGIGLAIGPAAFAALAGSIGLTGTLATAAGLGGLLSLTSSVLGMAAGFLTKRPKLASAGTQLDFVADPSAGEPYVMGDTMVGMSVVHQATWGEKNKFLGLVGILSCAGPIADYPVLWSDGNEIAFAGGNAVGYYHNWMLCNTQLGLRPEAAKIPMSYGGEEMPDWSGNRKLSSLAAAGLILKADIKDGKMFAGGLPKMMFRTQGVRAYDPRLDSDQPGGSGAQSPHNDSSYEYSDNPWVHHGTYAIGRLVNGVRVIGPGMPVDAIDWAAHMEAANVADFNGWKVSGRVMSTDRKWEVLKAIALSGGGYPIPTGAKLSCLVNVPRVSLETVTEADVRGVVHAPQSSMRRDRLNGAIPRFRSADHGWEIVPGNAIRSAEYLADDGGNEHTREMEFALVTDTGDGNGKDQAAQLAAYEVANTRERTGISVELGLVWSQFKVGDCLTLDLPKALLFNQKAVVIGKGFDFERSTVTLEFRTEDDAKHEWALGVGGQTTIPPAWLIPLGTGEAGSETDAATAQLIRLSYPTGLAVTSTAETAPGAGDGTIIITDHDRVYSDVTLPITGATLTNKAPGTYFIYYDDATRADGTPDYQTTTDLATSLNNPANPFRHNLPLAITVNASGGGGGGGNYGGGGYSGGGGFGGQTP